MVVAKKPQTVADKSDKPAKPEKADTDLTPSGLATAKAGELSDDASDEEKVAHNEKYLEAKLKARRG